MGIEVDRCGPVRQSRMIWYGHAKCCDDNYVGTMVLSVQLPGKRKRDRPKRRYLVVVKMDVRSDKEGCDPK